jgi:hypothetical protein
MTTRQTRRNRQKAMDYLAFMEESSTDDDATFEVLSLANASCPQGTDNTAQKIVPPSVNQVLLTFKIVDETRNIQNLFCYKESQSCSIKLNYDYGAVDNEYNPQSSFPSIDHEEVSLR